MVWLLDGYALERMVQRYGWRRVVLSQAVWDRCVRVPEGVVGQNESLRIWDLLCFLREVMHPWLAVPRLADHRVGFLTSVVNDNRDFGEDEGLWLPTEVELVAMPSIDDYEAPSLVVMLAHENRLV
jgi:hypothetical protein